MPSPAVDRSATVAQIVTRHAVAARVFQRHGIDFCCKGAVSVPAACEARRLDPERLFEELDAAVDEARGAPGEDPTALSTAALVARVVDRHHGYLRRALPYIAPIADKVARVHAGHDPRLPELAETFHRLSAALTPHLDEEEQVLFPALTARAPDLAVVRRELASMHEDHLAVGAMLGRIRELASDFALPEWACNTYRVLMAELEALEGDVLRHVHLENHVLMPRFV